MSFHQRRALLARSLALLGAVAARDADAQAPATRRPPRDVGRKFFADGSVHPFAGNTFIGHVGQQGDDFDAFDALLDVYRDLPRRRFARKLAALPPSSYHITVFGGVNDPDRGTRDWPAGFPSDAPIDEVTRVYIERLRELPPLQELPFDFVLDRAPPARVEGSVGVPLRPADDATAVRLAALRDALSLLTGLRRSDHERYEYHVTLGYLVEYLSAQEREELRHAMTTWRERLAAMRRPLRIRSFSFCSFRDMYAFRELRRL